MRSLKSKQKLLLNLKRLLSDFECYEELLASGETSDLPPLIEELKKRLEEQKYALFLSGPYDHSGAIVSLYAGAGGKDAQDFAEMLLRMILKFCEQQEFKAIIVDKSEGEEVGLKGATLEIEGDMAYGLFKSEHGVHRLVRLSPFNAGNTRETSFAKIDVIPLVEEDLSVEIPSTDLRIDVYRSGGKGGQSVNTTDSAVRITHLPTKISVQCQNERSQLQNKNTAMKVLASKLSKLREDAHLSKIKDLKGPPKEAAWGNQIRSYVLHPYHLVKDHRTNVEVTQVEKVLNGDLMPFMESYLKAQAMAKAGQKA